MADSKVITIKLSPELKEALRIEAFNRRVTISAFIRDLVEKELSTKEKK